MIKGGKKITVSRQLVAQSTKRLNKNKQNRLCTYNVVVRRVRVTIIAVEKQNLLNILIVCL